MRAIDADVLKRHIDKLPALPDGNFAGNHSALKALINMQPTIEPSTNNSEIPNSYDTISRQAVIDALHTCFSDGFDGDKWWNSTHVLAAIEGLPPAQPEQQHGRIFREIVVEYPSYCTYPEYKGKPYFSIKYTENGQEFIGYGTYKPEVLSKYLKEYFMPPAQLGTDCISRQALLDKFEPWLKVKDYNDGELNMLKAVLYEIRFMRPAQPEPKRGRWIHHPEIGWGETWLCDQCGEKTTSTVMGKPRANFCPNCGADMREVTE